jgi:hypothetical protein
MLPISHGYILATFFNASPAELADGAQWYQRASDAATIIASRYSITADKAAAVIAALSPSNRWERNVTDAEFMCRAYVLGGHTAADKVKVSTYGANKIKALRILAGESPLGVLGGLKVRAFYRCIMGDDSAVCVDGHAYAIWAGERIATTKTPKISSKLYDAIAADFIRAADTINSIMGVNYSPAQVQAITWLAYRRLVKELGLYRSVES